MKLTVLHLSDLHANVKDLPHVKKVMAGLYRDLEVLKSENIKPDVVFFTGDMINRGENAKDEFKLVSSEVIEPLLSKLNLTQDELFTIPGNHEIDRKKTYKEIETGLQHNLLNKENLSEYYASCSNGSVSFKAMQEKLNGYEEFSQAYRNNTVVTHSFFYDAYKIQLPNRLKVGIVGLNSAWRSSGFGSDEKRLIVGEEVVDEALNHIEGCDLKVCLCHHPFEMLCEWETKIVQRRVAKAFDFLFTGHVHDSDITYIKQMFGGVIVCTSGCLNKNHLNFYSIVQADFAKREVQVRLRKWYSERGVFDQETDKAAGGLVIFTDFQCGNPETADLIEISEVRGRMHDNLRKAQIINPLEGVVELSLKDVFVEPIISDTSAFDRNQENASMFGLFDLLKSNKNLIFFGRPDYGKTSLLEHSYTTILSDDKHYEGKIPVFIKFSEVPRNNPEGIRHAIRRQLDEYISREQVDKYLSQGRFVVLVDDFNDRQEVDRERKVDCLKQFASRYANCRYIFTATEYITQASSYEALKAHESFGSKSYFINSFSTSKIRQLIIRINTAQAIDVNSILDQILFYFHQLQIPVTPLTVTLFVGVLFRDKGRKNIQNEAYLIENYLETILEKLDPNEKSHDLDFREKESFLAHIAYRMVQRKCFEWSVNEFEGEKLAYFEQLEEDIPKSSVFDDFFDKGILQNSDRTISFKFKFWFYFFLAKAMEKDDAKKTFVLDLPEYINYATALGYKAGLSRNDASLLEIIDSRIAAEANNSIPVEQINQLEDALVDEALGEMTADVATEIKERNKAELIDQVRDQSLPKGDDPQTIESVEDCDRIGQLLTLHSDIIRNTREIDSESKRKYLKNNVEHYVSLMWATLQAFQSLVNVINPNELPGLFGKGIASKKQEARMKQMVEGSQRIVLQIVPLSMMFYMIDHLASPKLARSVGKLLDAEVSDLKRIFYLSLLFKLDQANGFKQVKKHIRTSRSMVCDFLLFTYLRLYCYENELTNEVLNEVVETLELIRTKHRAPTKKLPPFVTNTFADDFRKRVNLKNSLRIKKTNK